MNFGFGDRPMNRKIVVSLLSTSILVSVHFAEAQQPTKVPRIGFLLAPSRSAVSESLDAFRQGLRELGYVEGQNILIEYRYADGKLERLPDLAAELVHLKIDVIVAGGGMAVQAAKKASSATPIVFTGINDPVASGVVASLAQPAGNITGLSLGGYELHGKRLELLKETVPSVSRVAFFCYPASLTEPSALKETQASAKVLGVEVQSVELQSPKDFAAAFQATTKWGARALTVQAHPIFMDNRNRILEFAAKNRLPGIYPWREFVEDGGLMSYATKLPDLYRRAAAYVDKILKGRKPADLPVEQPTKFEFIINLKAAKQIGLTIPPNVLARADKVIK